MGRKKGRVNYRLCPEMPGAALRRELAKIPASHDCDSFAKVLFAGTSVRECLGLPSGAEPTKKSAGVEAAISAFAGKDRLNTIHWGKCMTCSASGLTRKSFVDDLSWREYGISGMCQACQDEVFREGE